MASQDPNRTLVESAIRKEKYKKILDLGTRAADECDSNSVVQNIENLSRMVIESNQLICEGNMSDRIGQTAEVVLDVQVVKMAHDLMGRTVQRIEHTQFSDDEYANAIKKLIVNDAGENDWTKMDRLATGLAKTFRYSQSMFGTFDFSVVDNNVTATQKQRAHRKRGELGAQQKPMNLTQTRNEKGSKKLEVIFTEVVKIYQENNENAIPYYKLIIDPQNMMHTFDNAFQMSFLFRDGRLSFEQDADRMPHVRPVMKSNRPIQNSENAQFAITLDYGKLQKMMKLYKINEPMIKIDRNLYQNTEEE